MLVFSLFLVVITEHPKERLTLKDQLLEQISNLIALGNPTVHPIPILAKLFNPLPQNLLTLAIKPPKSIPFLFLNENKNIE
jgi:hypothetical protein